MVSKDFQNYKTLRYECCIFLLSIPTELQPKKENNANEVINLTLKYNIIRN
jgi:hypothetical protein